MENTHIVTVEDYRKSHTGFRLLLISMILNDLERP